MKQRERTVGLPRYGAIDAYTLEELQREYRNSDAKGRIRLLENLSEKNLVPPYEIAFLAVTDENVEVRQWIARHGELDYHGKRHVNEQTNEWMYEFPDKNLADRLKKDADPFVRACLRENEEIYPRLEDFEHANHRERLALVRNPRVSNDLIEKIFDPEDKELGIDLEQRKELVLAYLTNSRNLDEKREKGKDEEPPFWTFEHLAKLWRFISKWPSDRLGNDVYKVYGALPNPFEREDILIVTEPDGKLRRLFWPLSEGIKDANDWLRHLAYSKVDYLEPEEIKAVLVENDPYALSGLYNNRSLYIAANLHQKLVPEGQHWFPLYSSGYARKLGAGNWVSVYDDTTRWNELVKVLYNGVTYEFFHPDTKSHLNIVGIFTDLRNHIAHRLEELSKSDDLYPTRALISLGARADLVGVDEEVESVPPANPLELFGGHNRASEGNFLEEKIDFIGKRLLSYDEKLTAILNELRHTLWTGITLVVIYCGWKLLVWILG